MTEDEKNAEIEYMLKAHARNMTYLWVIYNPNCKCPIDQFVMLDRFPMSEKIISQCPHCKKGCLLEISNPIRFHIKLNNQDYELKDLLDIVITEENQQTPFLKEYIEVAKETYSIDRV